jgi:transcriptional regulator with XRE-family HTH domain
MRENKINLSEECLNMNLHGNIRKSGRFHGSRLRKLRDKNDLSRKELAKRVGVSHQTIARLELKNEVAGTDTLGKLADFFKVPCGYLLGEDSLDLGTYSIGDELMQKVVEFLDKIMGARNGPAPLLDSMCMFIDSQYDKLGTKEGISEEEEVLGLWWSIVSAYSRGKWKVMIAKSEGLIRLAEALGRPNLAALGHAYKAKAIRNSGSKDAIKRAENEIRTLLEGEKFQSALTCRLIAKIYSRQKQPIKALDECLKAEKLMEESDRDDALFLLEKVKLLRNIASRNVDLAREMKKDRKKSLVSDYLLKADTYLKLCDGAISNLNKQLEMEAKTERMLIEFCRARYFDVSDNSDRAISCAEEVLKIARELDQESYAVRVRMFLCHIYVERVEKDKAIHYYGSLLPMRKYSKGRFRWQYERYVKEHEEMIQAYIQEECTFLNRKLEDNHKEGAAVST